MNSHQMPMRDDRDLASLREQHAAALGALGAAEDLGLIVGLLVGYLAYSYHDNQSYIFGFIALVATYFCVRYPYRKHEAALGDAYHKATGTGKYWTP